MCLELNSSSKFRLNPHVDNQPSLEDLRIAFGPSVEPVEWFPAFYRMDASCRLSSSELHEKGVLILIESDAHLTKSEGKIYGMDIASAVAVNALSVKPNDQVLDLCCAPGGKLCYISDLQGPTSTGTVTGVDVTLHRLHVCKSVCKKYKLHKFRLFHADGTTFGVHAPSRFGGQSLLTHDLVENAKAWMFVKPFHSSRLLRTDAQLECDSLLYDKVLVDAECTTDGSISHLFMDAKSSVDWKTFEKVLDPEKLKGLKALQVSFTMVLFQVYLDANSLRTVYRKDSFRMVSPLARFNKH